MELQFNKIWLAAATNLSKKTKKGQKKNGSSIKN